MKRILSIWLPHFVSERAARVLDDTEIPHAVVTASGNRITVRAANEVAREAGLISGMSLSDARALCPELITEPDDPKADQKALSALIKACDRYSPSVATQELDVTGSAGIWLDVTGCAHLFGGENAYLDRIQASFDHAGYRTQLGLADTKGAAWALSRFGGTPIARLRPGEVEGALDEFPLAALELSREAVTDLLRLGLTRIGDVARRPRAPLASRFGADLLLKLDRAMGRLPDPLAFIQSGPEEMRQQAFAEPIARTEDIEATLEHLLTQLCTHLAEQHKGVRFLTAALFRVDGETTELTIGTNRPSRDVAHLLKMLSHKLDGLDAGFGFELIRVTATRSEATAPHQNGLEQGARDGLTDLTALLDRLGNRLGPAAVSGHRVRESHLPERVVKRTAPLAALSAAPWPQGRPVRLLPKPTPVRVERGQSFRFSWRGHPHRLVALTGPERIEPEWWRETEERRDYYRGEDMDGRRFWLFHCPTAGWFVHGEFA